MRRAPSTPRGSRASQSSHLGGRRFVRWGPTYLVREEAGPRARICPVRTSASASSCAHAAPLFRHRVPHSAWAPAHLGTSAGALDYFRPSGCGQLTLRWTAAPHHPRIRTRWHDLASDVSVLLRTTCERQRITLKGIGVRRSPDYIRRSWCVGFYLFAFCDVRVDPRCAQYSFGMVPSVRAPWKLAVCSLMTMACLFDRILLSVVSAVRLRCVQVASLERRCTVQSVCDASCA